MKPLVMADRISAILIRFGGGVSVWRAPRVHNGWKFTMPPDTPPCAGVGGGAKLPPMGDWQRNKSIAAAILSSRVERRKAMAYLLALTMTVFAIGLWGINDWLATRLIAFALWWGGCGILTIFLMLFAVFDLLKTFREEKDKDRL